MGFGDNLRKYRLRMGWTQQQLADYMGKSKNNISQYELGKREPNCEQLLGFARLFGITADHLLSDDPDNALREAREPLYAANAPVLAPVYENGDLSEPSDFRHAPDDLPDAESLFYYRMTSDDMRDYRILAGDLLLLRRTGTGMCPGAIYLIQLKGSVPLLRMVRAGPEDQLILQGSSVVEPIWVVESSLLCLGALLRVEFSP